MEFSNWILKESSLNDLYNSTVVGFPNCTKRQHATQPIALLEFNWVPYLGMKTLFVKAIAKNEDRSYNPIIVFKKVNYVENGNVFIVDSSGKKHFLEQLSLESTQTIVRCQCKDFFWRGQHWNKVDKSLQGPDRKKYEAIYSPGSANPSKSPMLCKHLIKMTELLKNSGILK